MGSGNLAREPASKQPDEVILEIFREVGHILAEAREEKNLTIWQVAAQIHIRQQYLADLEEGRLHGLPGRVYILGFIRTYARLLDLDGEELVRRVSTLPNLPNYTGSQVPIPMHAEEGPNLPILILSAIFIAIVAMGGYFFLKPSTNPISTETSLLDTSQLPEPKQESQSGSSTEEKASSQQPLEPFPAVSPLSSAKPSALKEGAVVEKPAQPAKEMEKSIKDAASPSKKITLKAREPSWLEVRDERGRVFFMRVLQRGEEFVIPDKPGSVFNTGNAGGIDIFVGDQKLPSLGARGEVKRGIHLDTLQQ
jgi:cytoskeleton protein RodZ